MSVGALSLPTRFTFDPRTSFVCCGAWVGLWPEPDLGGAGRLLMSGIPADWSLPVRYPAMRPASGL